MAKLDTYIHCCSCRSEWLGNKARYDIEIAEREPCGYCGDRGTVHFGELGQCSNCATPTASEWVGCSACGSIWMAPNFSWEEKGCPYCLSMTSVSPVEGPSEKAQKMMEQMCAIRTAASDCPAIDAPTASKTPKTLEDDLFTALDLLNAAAEHIAWARAGNTWHQMDISWIPFAQALIEKYKAGGS